MQSRYYVYGGDVTDMDPSEVPGSVDQARQLPRRQRREALVNLTVWVFNNRNPVNHQAALLRLLRDTPPGLRGRWERKVITQAWFNAPGRTMPHSFSAMQ